MNVQERLQITGSYIAQSRPVQWMIFLGVVIALLLYAGYRWGRRGVENYAARPLPNNGTGIPSGWETSAEGLVEELHELLTSWINDSMTLKENNFKILYALTDDQLTHCYNLWNSKYGVKDKKTMTGKIDDETLVIPEWAGGVRNKLIYRLKLLKLP